MAIPKNENVIKNCKLVMKNTIFLDFKGYILVETYNMQI